jgi:hypothetical protein
MVEADRDQILQIIKRDYPAAYRSVQVDIFTEAQTAKQAALRAILKEGIKQSQLLEKLKTVDQSTTTNIRNIEIELKQG